MPRDIRLTSVDSVVLSIYKGTPSATDPVPQPQIIANYRIMAGTEEIRTAVKDITDLLTAGQKTAIAAFLTQVASKLSQLEVE